MRRRVTVGVAGAMLLAATAFAQAPDRDSKALKAIGEGRALYLTYCTACHGSDARGGPTGTNHQLAPDLTQIALRDGTFDEIHVSNHVGGAFSDRREMPRYERFFARRSPDGGPYAASRIYCLTRYLDFVQEPENAPPVGQ
jgi:mono/diheme cytochrome c family protein